VRKTTTSLTTALGLLLAPALSGQTASPKPSPCRTAVGCSVPEPSPVPELGLCLAGIGLGYWLCRQNKKPI